jgi:hypothetical protein
MTPTTLLSACDQLVIDLFEARCLAIRVGNSPNKACPSPPHSLSAVAVCNKRLKRSREAVHIMLTRKEAGNTMLDDDWNSGVTCCHHRQS